MCCEVCPAANVALVYTLAMPKTFYVRFKDDPAPKKFVGETFHERGSAREGEIVIKDDKKVVITKIQRDLVAGCWTEDAIQK
jgi:hypothetical protein